MLIRGANMMYMAVYVYIYTLYLVYICFSLKKLGVQLHPIHLPKSASGYK